VVRRNTEYRNNVSPQHQPSFMSYDSELFSHYYWHDTAKKIKYASEVLYERLDDMMSREHEIEDIDEFHFNQLALLESHMMLMGFALENLIKALSIKKYTSQGSSITAFEDLPKKVWKVKNAHDISGIAKNCHFPLTEDEADLLDRHTEFVIWAGRYHIPKSKSGYDDAFGNGKLHRKIGDHLIIDSIFDKAKTLLEENVG
jgi:hypothetical protein